MAMDNIALARRLIDDVWNKGNLGAIDEIIANDFVSRQPLLGETRGKDAFRRQVQMYRAAFPDLDIATEDVGAAGDRFFMTWIARATHRGSFLGVPPTNRKGEVRGITVGRVGGGKLVEHTQVYDTLTLFQIMGVVPTLERLVRVDEMRQARP